MASGEVYQAVRDFLVTNWTTTPIAFENENQDTAENVIPPKTVVPWIEIEMTGTDYTEESLGAGNPRDNRWDEQGLLFINIYVQSGTGSVLGRTYAKQLVDLFRGLSLIDDALEFRDSVIGMGRPGLVSGNWYMIPVHVEWRRQNSPATSPSD
jgi:Bacteriophage related domain of unknown function